MMANRTRTVAVVVSAPVGILGLQLGSDDANQKVKTDDMSISNCDGGGSSLVVEQHGAVPEQVSDVLHLSDLPIEKQYFFSSQKCSNPISDVLYFL